MGSNYSESVDRTVGPGPIAAVSCTARGVEAHARAVDTADTDRHAPGASFRIHPDQFRGMAPVDTASMYGTPLALHDDRDSVAGKVRDVPVDGGRGPLRAGRSGAWRATVAERSVAVLANRCLLNWQVEVLERLVRTMDVEISLVVNTTDDLSHPGYSRGASSLETEAVKERFGMVDLELFYHVAKREKWWVVALVERKLAWPGLAARSRRTGPDGSAGCSLSRPSGRGAGSPPGGPQGCTPTARPIRSRRPVSPAGRTRTS